MIRLYYCRDCGNYTYFEFTSKYVYNASLKGISYLDVTPVKLDITDVKCNVCGSHNIGYVEFKDAKDIPDLIPLLTIDSKKRIYMFESMRKKFGGGLFGDKNIKKEVDVNEEKEKE